jgi:hypothetical protein
LDLVFKMLSSNTDEKLLSLYLIREFLSSDRKVNYSILLEKGLIEMCENILQNNQDLTIIVITFIYI